MNVLELIKKNDPNVQVLALSSLTKEWAAHEAPQTLFSKISQSHISRINWRIKIVRSQVRGLVLRSGMRIVVSQAAKFWPNFAAGEGAFWLKSIGTTEPRAIVYWAKNGAPDTRAEYVATAKLKQISVPASVSNGADLIIEIPPQKGAKVFWGVHRVLDRNTLYASCSGQGVEVGPGPKPQITPDRRTHVKYVEQATPDQWQKLYGKDAKVLVDPSLWQHYVVGNADNIPAQPNSLDFIFSSHVIEHLANPLGHFAYWASLLKKGGVVAAVIPDKGGCKDYVFEPSTTDELISEFRHGSMQPTLAHYERWAKWRAPKTNPAELLASGRSIHVHFYTPESMQEILAAAINEIGYRKFSITHEHNHKDFFILLQK